MFQIKEQTAEQRIRRFDCRGFARTHDFVNINQSVFAAGILVRRHRVADIRTDIDVVNVQQSDFVDLVFLQRLQQIFGNFLTRFDQNFTGLDVDHVFRKVAPDQFFFGNADFFNARFLQFRNLARRNLLTRFDQNFARLGVNQIVVKFQSFQAFGFKSGLPPLLVRRKDNFLIEIGQDFFLRHSADFRQINRTSFGFAFFAQRNRFRAFQRIKQRRYRQFATTVDTNIDQVLRIKFEIQPRTAIRNDACGKQIFARRMRLAFVMVKKHAGRTVHLRYDNAFRSVHDECSRFRHQRHIAHINVLFLNVADRTGSRIFVNVPDNQTQRNAQRRGIRHTALDAFIYVIFGFVQFVLYEFKLAAAGKVLNRKNRL